MAHSTPPPATPVAPLTASQLRWQCSTDLIAAARQPRDKATGDVETAFGVIGQRRALEAIQLGVGMAAPGFHIFVSGLVGSGRSYSIQSILEAIATRTASPLDRVYVNNFHDPSAPRLIELPPGQGRKLQQEMRDLADEVHRLIRSLSEDAEHEKQRDALAAKFREREQTAFREFEAKLKEVGLALVTIQRGQVSMPELVPEVEGEPVPWDVREQSAEYREKIGEEEIARRKQAAEGLRGELEELIKQSRRTAREMLAELRRFEQETVARLLDQLIDAVREEFRGHEAVQRYLDQVYEHVVQNLEPYKQIGQEESSQPQPPHAALGRGTVSNAAFRVFDVNVVQDATEADEPPIIVEQNPTYTNLFGTIEREFDGLNRMRADFMQIRAGSLLRADGGYLVMYVREVLQEPGVWRTLMRTLKSGLLEIQTPEAALFIAPSALKPEPIPINTKVILIGDERYYRLLDVYEDDFHKIFKIKAEFDREIKRTDQHLHDFIGAIDRIVQHERMMELTNDGMAALVEQAARLAGRRDRLYTRFGMILDIVHESCYWAQRDGKARVDRAVIETTIQMRRDRHSLIDEKLHEAILEERLLIATDGTRIAQVNGLSVLGIGPYLWGKPNRITATVGAGPGGIVNIEREARLSGSTHDKGVLILTGYLRQRFGRRQPLALTASLAFEQSYGGVDGDSATLAELYALLSAIGELPLRQDLAVTGSMNQHGDVQPVGGINEKIEGFFAICQERGLTGTQGVMIPAANVEDLMLSQEVVAAVRAGRFHVYPVRHVDEGLALLTALPLGEADAAGVYPADSVNGRIQTALGELAERTKGLPSETVRVETVREPQPREPQPGGPPPTPPPPDEE